MSSCPQSGMRSAGILGRLEWRLGAGADSTRVTAQVAFQRGPTGPFLAEAVTVTTGADARASVATVEQAPSRCANFTGAVPGGGTMRLAIGQLSVSPLGEDTSGVRVTATVDGVPLTIYAHLIAVAFRGLTMMVVVAQLNAIDAGDAEAITRTAFDKLRKLAG